VDVFVDNYSGGDLTPPAFALSNPEDDDGGVPVNTNITLEFTEYIDANTSTSDLARVYLKTGSTTVPSSITIDLFGRVVINPTADLANSTLYYVTWDEDALKDESGNAVAGVTGNETLKFTTAAAPSAGGGGGGGGGGIVVTPTPADASAKIHTKVFAVNSSKLNKAMRASILEILSSNKDASSVVCRPVIPTSNASAAAKKLARARSVAVCNYISSISDLDVGVGKSYLVVSNAEQRRTVRITIG
jgi:hypothetical protein